MNKKIKIFISCVLCLVIVSIGTFIIYNNKTSLEENKSKDFIKSINYLKNDNYIEAYNTIKNSDKEEINIIQTIILHKFCSQLDIVLELDEKIIDEAEHITDYLTYTYLYSKDSSYQKKIDKIYDEEYSKLFEIKNKIPENIMFEDSIKYYNLYFEYLDLNNGTFKNYEYNILNNKNKLIEKFDKIQIKLEEIQEEYEKLIGMYPKSEIPEEYQYLFDL